MHSSTLKIRLKARDQRIGTFSLIVFAPAFFLICTSGCQKAPAITDNSAIDVQPGYGISNVCEIGMTFSQIKKANGDATAHGIYDGTFSWKRLESSGRGRFMLVPSLGAIAAIGNDEPLSLVEFYVWPHKDRSISALEVHTPFRGKLGNKLSFKDGTVSKMDVETIYGNVIQVATNAATALAFRRKGEPFIHDRGNSVEEIWYPSKGVAFGFVTNVVKSFWIYKPIETNR